MDRFWTGIVLCLIAEMAFIYHSHAPSKPNWETVREAVVQFNVEVTTPTVLTVGSFISPVTVPIGGWEGTGFVVTADGYIITCAHVVAPEPGGGDLHMTVSFYGVPAKGIEPHVVYRNDTMDIALVKVDVPVALPHLKLGSGNALKLGEAIYAIGHPRGLTWSVFDNLLSAKRFITAPQVAGDGAVVDQYAFQLEHPMAAGISGGPVVNSKGEVVCMVNVSFMPKAGAETDFCVPVEEIKWVMETQGVGYN